MGCGASKETSALSPEAALNHTSIVSVKEGDVSAKHAPPAVRPEGTASPAPAATASGNTPTSATAPKAPPSESLRATTAPPAPSETSPVLASNAAPKGSIPPSATTTPFTRVSLQIRRIAAGPLECFTPCSIPATTSIMPEDADTHRAHLAAGSPAAAQLSAVQYLRQLTCSSQPPSPALLLEEGYLAPLVVLAQGGGSAQGTAVQVEALWALANIAALGPEGALRCCDAGACNALVTLIASSPAGEVAELAFWAAGNIAGGVDPATKVQPMGLLPDSPTPVAGPALLLEAGIVRPVLVMLSKGVAAYADGVTSDWRVTRAAAWCVHGLAKFKHGGVLVDAIPVLTSALLKVSDMECLTCACWALVYIASNPDNLEHMRQALVALPKLVLWVREASSSLCTPSLMCLGALCQGSGAQDHSTQVVEAEAVPAMLKYLKTAATAEGGKASVQMQRDALYALSNVAGSNSITVQALCDAGAFEDVQVLLRDPGLEPSLKEDCLYVLINPLATAVATDFVTTESVVKAGVISVLCSTLQQELTPPEMMHVLTGLQDALKKGQQLLRWRGDVAFVKNEPPPQVNPVYTILLEKKVPEKLQHLNRHGADNEIRLKANNLLNILQFM